MAAPRKLDVQLEGLAAFQAGVTLKAGDPLALREDGGRLVCVTQAGAVVGLVPADKRAQLTRGPWSGTVRSVKRQAAPAPAAGEASEAAQAQEGGDDAGLRHSGQQPHGADQLGAEGQQAEQQAQGQRGAQVVRQLLVRFVPQEQRWERRQAAPAAEQHDEGGARLSQEQLERLAASEEVRWMLRDERLQKVVADVDAAPDRERALVRALQAPNFKEFADKVLGVVAPEGPA